MEHFFNKQKNVDFDLYFTVQPSKEARLLVVVSKKIHITVFDKVIPNKLQFQRKGMIDFVSTN